MYQEKYHTSLEKQILSPVQDPFVITWDAFLPSFQSLEDFSSSSVSLSSPFFMCLELEVGRGSELSLLILMSNSP